MPQTTIASLVAQARSGKLISFPTDTVPALAALPQSAPKIYQAKGRDLSKPLILMGAEAKDLWPFVQTQHPDFATWEAIATQYWPGALTLVLPSSNLVPDVMHPQTPNTIGLRVPDCAIAQIILQQTGPLATTSINRSGQNALTCLGEIESQFPDVFVPLAQFWPAPKGDAMAKGRSETIASTVVEWQNQTWITHRQGTIEFSC